MPLLEEAVTEAADPLVEAFATREDVTAAKGVTTITWEVAEKFEGSFSFGSWLG